MGTSQIPEHLLTAINNFFTWSLDGKDHNTILDNITQNALFTIDKNNSEEGGNTFFYMRSLKDLLTTLKSYANE